MRHLLFILLISNGFDFNAQYRDLKSELIESFVASNLSDQQVKKRRLMFGVQGAEQKKNFINSGFAGLMFIYQNVFSEQISASCMYQTSCSEYTKLQIEKNGLIIGSLKGFHQLMHCTHGAIEEVPPYMKANYSSKILNSVE